MWNFDKLIWEFIVIIYYPQEPNKEQKYILSCLLNQNYKKFKIQVAEKQLKDIT